MPRSAAARFRSCTHSDRCDIRLLPAAPALALAFGLFVLALATANAFAQSAPPTGPAAASAPPDLYQTVVPLFAPPGMESGREAAALVVGAIAANFWLDGDVALSGDAADFFAAKTDPLRAQPDSQFLSIVDLLRENPIEVSLYARLIQDTKGPPRLGFAWDDEGVPPPSAITYRTSLERQCFTLNIPIRWERLIDAPLDLTEDVVPNQRAEMRLNIIALPSDVYAAPVGNDARQVFGVRCQSHTVIVAAPIAGALQTVDGRFVAMLAAGDP